MNYIKFLLVQNVRDGNMTRECGWKQAGNMSLSRR